MDKELIDALSKIEEACDAFNKAVREAKNKGLTVNVDANGSGTLRSPYISVSYAFPQRSGTPVKKVFSDL